MPTLASMLYRRKSAEAMRRGAGVSRPNGKPTSVDDGSPKACSEDLVLLKQQAKRERCNCLPRSRTYRESELWHFRL
jgi:hypothetical protein